MPTLGGLPQAQAISPGLDVSSWSREEILTPPMLIGKIHDQQISVIGLANLPVQVAAWDTLQTVSSSRAESNFSRVDFIDSQPFAFLPDRCGRMRDSEVLRQNAALIKEYFPLPFAHQFQWRSGNQYELDRHVR